MLAESIERPNSATERPSLPYPGLRPFEENETRNFFGRETEIDAILGLLEEEQLVVVHGSSGCGKSSVVRAGVLPIVRLDALASGTAAKIVVIRPSDPGGPLRSLAAALEREFPPQAPADRPAQETPDAPESAWVRGTASRRWCETLVASPDWKADIEGAVKASNCTLCIVLDQFEEIFALQRRGLTAEVDRVIEFLISLGDRAGEETTLGERPLSVIVTMRSDYLGHCSLWDGFAETVNRAQYLLPKISTVGLLRAIHQPALKYDGSVDEAVADHLLPVMAGEIDGLPILQHALMRAWQDATPDADGKRRITVDNLKQIGTAAGALSKHAEEAFAKATKGEKALRKDAEWMFRALSDIDADGRIVRRSVLLPDLVAQTGADRATIEAIVEVFRQPEFSFLTPFPPEKLSDESNISVTHEALLRRWERISSTTFGENGRPDGLVYREFSDGMIWRSLAVQAEAFASDPGRVLSAAVTEQRLPWFQAIARRPGWARRYPTGNLVGNDDSCDEQLEKVAALMKASEENLKREHKKLEEERRTSAKLRKQGRLIIALSVVIAAMLGWFVWKGADQLAIEKQRLGMEKQRLKAFTEGVAREQAQFDTANTMARRQCQGVFDEGAQLEACVRERSRDVYYDIARSQRNGGLSAAGNAAREDCRRRGVPEDRLTACVAEQLQTVSPYGGTGGSAPPP